MKLLKPTWVTHDGYPIFSIDIHPDGSRFATGGQGTGDSGRVVIWNMAPVLDAEIEGKENVPKYLSRMDNHLNCVNCVRWSPDGKFLASAGDDKIIMIWQIARYNNNTSSSTANHCFNSSFGNNVETWRCVASLRGHSGDILDLSWSPTDPWLASCSVDNNIIIWNSSKWNEIITTLTGHTGLVKGVSFDPVGKYVASQSDDKSLKIWRTQDWKEEHCLTEPFIECGGTTHVLRLNWSPDGQFLVSAHAMNNRGSVAQIVERDGWRAQRDFVGHRKAVTCVRFNSHLLKKTVKKGERDKEVNYSCLAVGSRDRSLSVWLTSSVRPLVVFHELFENSVMDMSWSRDGTVLLACSWDGSVACLDFEGNELGTCLTETETTLYMEKLYGKSMKNSGNSSLNLLAEDVDFIRAREENMSAKSCVKTNGHVIHSSGHDIHDNRSMNDSRSSTSSRLMKGPTDKQIEIKMSNGKRRITPLYIPPPIDLDGIPIPFNSTVTTFSTSEESRSKIPVEKRDSNLSPAKEELVTSSPSITPVVVKPQSMEMKSEVKSPPTSSPPSQEKVPSSASVATSGSKRKHSESTPASTGSAAKKKPGRPPAPSSQEPKTQPSKQQQSAVAASTSIASVPEATSGKKNNDVSFSKTERKPRVNLVSLVLDRVTTHPIRHNNPEDDASFERVKGQSVEVENNLNKTKLSALRLKDVDGNKVWEVIFPISITGVTSNDFLTGVTISDNSLSVYSTTTGRKLHPPLLLSSPAASISSFDSFILVITSDGKLSVFDVKQHKSLVKNESLNPLFMDGGRFRSDVSITGTSINKNGSPVVCLSNRKSFVYDLDFNTWSVVCTDASGDLISICSDIKFPPGSRRDPLSHPLAAVQSIHKTTKSSSSVFSCNTSLQANATISFLDQQVTTSLMMGSVKEYKHWLLSLTQVLTDEGREDRLKELCSSLLGPVFSSDDEWKESQVLGLNKRQLLQEVLLIMTSNLRLQRLYSEFKEQLAIIQDKVTVNGNHELNASTGAVMDTSS